MQPINIHQPCCCSKAPCSSRLRLSPPHTSTSPTAPWRRAYSAPHAHTRAAKSSNTETHRVSTVGSARWQSLWLGRMPLVGLELLSDLLPKQVNGPLQQHSFLLLRTCTIEDEKFAVRGHGTDGHGGGDGDELLLDFLPLRPTHPQTALKLVSGGSTPGGCTHLFSTRTGEHCACVTVRHPMRGRHPTAHAAQGIRCLCRYLHALAVLPVVVHGVLWGTASSERI